MTNGLALSLGVLIVGAIILDLAFFGTTHMFFLGQKFYALLDWVAFWR
ncbi:hypothetical protein [Roseivivax sp. CAU 1753]